MQHIPENEFAFYKIYRQHYNMVFKRAFYYTGCPGKAEDITQEVFEKIWLKWERITVMDHIKGYLLIATRNTCINRRKRERRQFLHTGIDATSELPAMDNAEELIIAKECNAVYNKAKDLLPAKRRKIYELIMEGKQYNEVARLLNLSLCTIKKQRQLATQSVRTYMNKTLRLGYSKYSEDA